MEHLKKFFKQMERELKDASRYIKMAINSKNEDRQVAEQLFNIANQELNHFEIIKSLTQRELDKLKDEEDYEYLKSMFEWEREKALEKQKEIKVFFDIFRE